MKQKLMDNITDIMVIWIYACFCFGLFILLMFFIDLFNGTCK